MGIRKAFYSTSAKILKMINHFDEQEVILIFSDPRGGSTWITECISSLSKSVIVWEPLHPDSKNKFQDLGFSSRQYIPENEEWAAAKNNFGKLFRGNVLSSNSFFLSNPLKFLIAKRLIVKICRGNAILPWITKNFSFKYKPIYLLRHPFAVVASQLKHGAWDIVGNQFKIPKGRYSGVFKKHESFLLSLNSPEEMLTATWCITNQIPLSSPRNNNDWILIFYEHFLKEPENELKKIFKIWNLDFPTQIYDKARNLSSTTDPKYFEQNIEEQLSKWAVFFDDKQIKKMDRVLSYFGVTAYSSESFLPVND